MRKNNTSPPRPTLLAHRAKVIALALLLAAPGVAAQLSARDTMEFAAEMARDGNWREAKYRWRSVLEGDRQNPRLLNNLAVACEALGQLDEATSYYEEASTHGGGDDRIRGNYRRFTRFVEMVHPERVENGGDGSPATPADANDGADSAEALAASTASGGGRNPRNEKKKKGKTTTVSIQLPVPPRLDVDGMSSMLVASFVAANSSFLDVNRELTKYLRREFRKRSPLEVIEAIPAPAIPEQSLEDLLANSTFWKHLAREYGADLIVSGIVDYDRSDVSGFRDVDVVNSSTGQKVRQTRFVEQEEFSYGIDVIFMDGASGTLLFRDRMSQSAVFQGSQNDPIAAFYEMSGAMAGDVLGVITARTRVEGRLIFKR